MIEKSVIMAGVITISNIVSAYNVNVWTLERRDAFNVKFSCKFTKSLQKSLV